MYTVHMHIDTVHIHMYSMYYVSPGSLAPTWEELDTVAVVLERTTLLQLKAGNKGIEKTFPPGSIISIIRIHSCAPKWGKWPRLFDRGVDGIWCAIASRFTLLKIYFSHPHRDIESEHHI